MTEQIKFESEVLYSLEWLEQRLSGMMTVKTFLANLGLDCTGRGRMFQNGVWGHEILTAVESVVLADKSSQKLQAAAVERFSNAPRKGIKQLGGFVPVGAKECLTGRNDPER